MICTTYDREYFEDKTCWIAELSNGVLVYQDDGRETEKEYSSWIRLKEYLKENNLNIIRLFLKFRSNVLDVIPSNKEGYFFFNGHYRNDVFKSKCKFLFDWINRK